MIYKKTILLFFTLLSLVTYSKEPKNKKLNAYFKYLTELEFKKAYQSINKLTDLSLRRDLLVLTSIIEDNGQSLKDNLPYKIANYKYSESQNNFQDAIRNLIKGYLLLWYDNKRIKSYHFFYTSYNLAKLNKLESLRKFTLLSTLIFYKKGNLQNDNSFIKYLEEYHDLCNNKNDYLIYLSYKFSLIMQKEIYNERKSLNQKFYNQLLGEYDSVAKLINNKLLVFYYRDKGNILIRTSPKKAQELYLKQLEIIDTTNYYKPIKYIALCNLSRVCSLTKNYKKGLTFLREAEKYKNINDTIKNNLALSIYKANHFGNLKMYDSAYYLSEKIRKLGYLFNFQKHNTEISKIREELKTEKKEKENQELKAKRKQDKLILTGGVIFIFLSGIITFLNLKNSRKKRQLAEQQKKLEKQKNLTLIKEQEITTINAMINGQEKERIRIAEDLHDNIGSVLATLKLHFENLKLNREKKHFNQEELYNKTEKLIDETYYKVRSIAHAKNAGVIANQGLLVAIKIMAEKISSANKIKIHVVDYGLNNRLENNIEITVFRIIQELITNIIKHAEASEATINISLFDANLNIIIEDNGKGFKISEVKLETGMGIASIKKRIQYLKGTFQIDSTINKGSSIIINIPIHNT